MLFQGLGLLENAGGEDLALEITPVELHAQDGLVEALEVRNGELVVQKIEPHGLEMDVPPELFQGDPEDLPMVEGEGRDVIDRKPGGFLITVFK